VCENANLTSAVARASLLITKASESDALNTKMFAVFIFRRPHSYAKTTFSQRCVCVFYIVMMMHHSLAQHAELELLFWSMARKVEPLLAAEE
jgi:hypothetical protein